MAHDIFISYSREDSAIVDRIDEELNKYGISSFVDRSHIDLGEDFAEVISKSLFECEVLLFVWSENSNNSENAANEIALAIDFQKTIISFKIGNFTPDYKLAYRLVRFNRIDTTTFNEPQVIELCKKIARRFGKHEIEMVDVQAKEGLATKVTINKSVSVQIGNLIIADRNLGATEGGVALNYTNYVDHADHENLSLKGGYYTWDEANKACPDGWRLPTKAELEIIESKMKFSFGKAYLEDNSGNQCCFPFSGYSDRPSRVSGNYWSSTAHDDSNACSLYLSMTDCSIYDDIKSNGFSVRCVKTAP